jgi:hypothetical protein
MCRLNVHNETWRQDDALDDSIADPEHTRVRGNHPGEHHPKRRAIRQIAGPFSGMHSPQQSLSRVNGVTKSAGSGTRADNPRRSHRRADSVGRCRALTARNRELASEVKQLCARPRRPCPSAAWRRCRTSQSSVCPPELPVCVLRAPPRARAGRQTSRSSCATNTARSPCESRTTATGLTPAQAPKDGGLRNIHDRIGALGDAVTITSSPGTRHGPLSSVWSCFSHRRCTCSR